MSDILIKSLDRILKRFLNILLGIMVVTVTWQVVTRYVFNAPSSYTAELSTFLLIWISLLGAAFALGRNEHLGIDVIPRKLALDSRKKIIRIGQALIFTFSLFVFVIGGGYLVYMNLKMGQVSAAFEVLMGYVYTVIPLSGLIMMIYSLHALQKPEIKIGQQEDDSAVEGFQVSD